MGTAFVAIADDPSAIVINPAGLVQQKGTNVYGGTTSVIPSSEYTAFSGHTEETDFQVFFPPHLYIASDVGSENLRLGLGIASLFGIGGRQWDDSGLTRYASVENSILTLSVSPTVAYRVTPTLSVGAGLNYMISRNEAERMTDQSFFGYRDGKSTMKADGGGWGWNIGILYTPDTRWSFGFAYRSEIRIPYDGDMEISDIAPPLRSLFGGGRFKTDIHTTSTFPEIVGLGVAFRPDTQWTLAFDVEWTGWSSFDESTLYVKKKIPEAGITNQTIVYDWDDIWLIKAGAEYRVNDRLALRGGYAFLESPVPDRTFNPANPDSAQHNFSLGCGYKIKEYIIDFFYMAAFYEDKTVQNDILSGTYENFIHYAGLSIGRSF